MVQQTTETTTDEHLIKPYSCFWHPEKSWLDLFVTIIIWLIFPVHKLVNYPAVKNSEETKKQQESLRGFMRKGSAIVGKPHIAKWAANSNCAIIQFTYTIKRTPLLKEWGLYKENFDDRYPSGDIDVILRFPASILKETMTVDMSKRNEYGCVVVDKLDIQSFPADVPLVIHFFGGGMTIGVPNDGDGLEMAQKVCQLAAKPIILAGVCYSQSPEYSFPVAVEEALTSVSEFLTALPDRKIHISGISAGGNLAAVTTMEMQRKNPGRIASCTTLCPMLNPCANTLSYYLNRNAFAISSEWLRWCWKAYLVLPKTAEAGGIMDLDTMEARLDYGSNCTTWEASAFGKGTLARLVNPTLDLPKGLGSPNGPKFVVLTNEGDALRDEGIELVENLKSTGATVNFLRQSGTHWFGTILDKKNYAVFVSAWRDVLFSA